MRILLIPDMSTDWDFKRLNQRSNRLHSSAPTSQLNYHREPRRLCAFEQFSFRLFRAAV